MNDQNIKKLHDKNITTVFFDIFDTIVSRKIQPEYTKKVWANHLVKRLDLPQNILDVYNKRNKLETALGEKNANNGYDWEFTYDSLLEALYTELNIKIAKEEFKKIATEIEVEIESSVQVADVKMLNEIKRLRKEHKKIYCISDMYLSKQMLTQIFTNLGIIDLFDDIYVSCEYLKSKRSGNLYKLVLKELKLKAKECIMVGDNKLSDYDNAKSNGIKAIHLDRQENYKKYTDFLSEYNEQVIENKFIELSKTPCDNFEHIAFTLYQFTDKLYHYLRRNNYNEVFFLSREGEFLKKIFDEYQKNIYGKKLDTHYILVSRKSTYLPSLKKLDAEDFGGLLKQYLNSSISEFLGSLNLSKEDREEILESYYKDCQKLKNKPSLSKYDQEALEAILNKDYNYKVSNLYKSSLLEILKNNKTFQKIYEKNRSEQNRLFKRYIEERTTNKRICVVDVGWNGSIQDNIQNALGAEYEINGCLFGLVSRENKVIKNKVGLIFSNYPDNSKNFQLFIENRTMFEILLGASHGSATRYVEKDGKVDVTTFEKQEEKDIYKNVVSKIQKDMFTINKELCHLLTNTYYDNYKINKLINKLHYNMVFKPTEIQCAFFNGIYHYENFGVFEFSKFNTTKKLSPKYYLKENIKFFVKYKSFFYDTFWPTLKLTNEKLYLQKLIYRNIKKYNLKRKGIL